LQRKKTQKTLRQKKSGEFLVSVGYRPMSALLLLAALRLVLIGLLRLLAELLPIRLSALLAAAVRALLLLLGALQFLFLLAVHCVSPLLTWK
jgi:hypothetical protein